MQQMLHIDGNLGLCTVRQCSSGRVRTQRCGQCARDGEREHGGGLCVLPHGMNYTIFCAGLLSLRRALLRRFALRLKLALARLALAALRRVKHRLELLHRVDAVGGELSLEVRERGFAGDASNAFQPFN